MMEAETLIRNARIVDGSGGLPRYGDIAILDGKIHTSHLPPKVHSEIDAAGLTLCPGFIDTHTHDDLVVIASPAVLPKISQGVTTVIVGNCGVSASPYSHDELTEPMGLLGSPDQFVYATFEEYASAVTTAKPSVNVAALVGHTTLRGNYLNQLDRPATGPEIERMRADLRDSLKSGALGLSTGLAYPNAMSAPTEEVTALAGELAAFDALYTTHLRSETDAILPAIDEALWIGRSSKAPVVVSHLKCAGIDNWGRIPEVFERLHDARNSQEVGWDCYPYSASSSLLDLRQVDERVAIQITWSEPHPEAAGKPLAELAESFGLTQIEAAKRLQPAGAIYHCMAEEDVRRVLKNPITMIGSDGLPCDPLPHPRLWGTFPRVLGAYCRDLGLFTLEEAVRKMTSLPAQRFRLKNRGRIQEGYWADLVLIDAEQVMDRASYADPNQIAQGIHKVWVNGMLTYSNGQLTGERDGRFLRHRG